MSRRCKLLLACALLLAVVGCRLTPHVPAPTPAVAPVLAPHVGAPYDIVADASLLTVLVYRGGTLAGAGHNHVIASRALAGTIYVPADLMRSSFEVRIPVDTLTVDEEALRAQQRSADFPPDVPESAKQGTRRNMLGPALLDAEQYPEIVLRAVSLAPAPASVAALADSVLARIESTVRGQPHMLAVVVRYERLGEEVMVTGDFPLRQSDLGLTPFSAMLGALQVKDEMHVSIRIVAHAAPLRPAQWSPSSASKASARYTLRSAASMMAGSTATARFSSGSNQ